MNHVIIFFIYSICCLSTGYKSTMQQQLDDNCMEVETTGNETFFLFDFPFLIFLSQHRVTHNFGTVTLVGSTRLRLLFLKS